MNNRRRSSFVVYSNCFIQYYYWEWKYSILDFFPFFVLLSLSLLCILFFCKFAFFGFKYLLSRLDYNFRIALKRILSMTCSCTYKCFLYPFCLFLSVQNPWREKLVIHRDRWPDSGSLHNRVGATRYGHVKAENYLNCESIEFSPSVFACLSSVHSNW